MKKILLSLATCTILSIGLTAQEIAEPEFIGECIMVKSDNTVTPLEKQITRDRSVASAGLLLTGIGKYKSQIQVDGCCSEVKIGKNQKFDLIIRGVDNKTDPMSIVRIFKFDQRKNVRRAEIASVNTFGAAKTNKLDYVDFKGTKYGESSYKLSLANLEPGEYGVVISNPNALDEKQAVVSSFAVTE